MTRDRKPPLLAKLGTAVRRRREQLGLSQEELGGLAALHRTYIGSIERGEKNISVVSLVRVARVLQTTPSELLKEAGS